MAKLRTTMPALIQESDPKKKCPYCGGKVDFTQYPDFISIICDHCGRWGSAPTADVKEAEWKT